MRPDPIVAQPTGADRGQPLGGQLGASERVRPRRSWHVSLAAPERLLLLSICLAGLGLRLWNLGRRSFWLDELISLGISAQRLPDFLLALSAEANMTLYYWLLFVWLRIVSLDADEAAIRLPTALLGAIALPLIYLVGRRLHSPMAGLAAAALLAVNTFHIGMSQQARGYAALASLAILSYLLLDRAVQRERRRDWALHGVAIALAFYTHFYAGLTILAQATFVLSRRSRVALAGLAISGLVAVVLLAQLVPFVLQPPHEAKVYPPLPDPGALLRLLMDYSGGSSGTLLIYAVLVALGVWPGRSNTDDAGYRNWLLVSWFVVPVGLAFGLSLIWPTFRDRYLLATLPALPLMAGVGFTRLPRPIGVASLGVVAWLSLGDLQANSFDWWADENWREAATYASRAAVPGDGYVFITKWGQHGFDYYAGWHWGREPGAPYSDVLEPFDWREAMTAPQYRGLLSMDSLESFGASHSRVWLALTHETDPLTGADTAAPVQEWLATHGFETVRARRYSGVRLQLFQRRA